MLNIAILGSTGSIGTQALNVVRRHRKKYNVVALSAHTATDLLQRQAEEFKPRYVAVTGVKPNGGCFAPAAVLTGQDALEEIAALKEVDAVLYATVGFAGVRAVRSGIRAGKRILLANKEALVCAGGILMPELTKFGGTIIPVDSEHSAIFQCMEGRKGSDVNRVIITASGGAFRDKTACELASVTAEDALRHPNWNMGKKITVDCATLVNKGLEVIEAKWLFDLSLDQIDCVLHRESIIHSMVELKDGCTLAQMSEPTMELPIAYALSYPNRIESTVRPLNFAQLGKLTFEKLDTDRFPCFSIVIEAGRRGGVAPAAVSGANEVLVEAFLRGKLPFLKIPALLEQTLARFSLKQPLTMEAVIQADSEARKFISMQIK